MKNSFYQSRAFLTLSALFLMFFVAPAFADAATYYVSTTGNNANPGTSALPWKTVAYACGNTLITAGDTIYVNAGTYTEAQCSLRPGINLQGAGIDQTIIKSTAISDWNWYLSLESPTPTNGNQTISGITFNGQWTSGTNGTWEGIWVARRSNVIIHDIKVINFYDRGVIFDGHGMINPLTDPGIYATGNKFYNNTILNSARMMGGTGAGLLNIGGQNGMEIYNNTLIQDQRANGYNGWPIKYWENGFLNGVKIYNNVLKKKNFVGDGQGNGDWDFAIELFNIKGLEIANNTIQGSIDLNYNYKGTYPYSVWIHDNVIDHNPANTKMESGIIFEFATQSALVERNIINNVSHAILFNAREPQDSGGYNYPAPTGGYSSLTNNVIRNNVFSNIYNPLCCGGGAGIQVWIEEMNGTTYIQNMYIYNNVFSVRPNSAPPIGFDFPQVFNGTADGLIIRNNILQGFSDTWFEGNSGPKFKNTVITHNNAWQNGNSNQVRWIGGNPTVGYVNSNNLSVDPKFVSSTNFNLQSTSPMINAGFTPLTLPSGVTAVPFNGAAPDIGYAETGNTGGNVSPVANAGPDQTITLPTSTITLTGTGTDSDGTIASYLWTKTAGPTAGTITTPSSASTTVTGLVQGTYTFQLQVTDNLGAIGTDTMNVVVNQATATATSYTFTGPTGGMVGSASTAFTITPNAVYTGTVTIAISGGGLSSVTKTFSNSSAVQTFTITPTAGGAITLTPTSNPTLTNPAALSYFANQAPVVNAGLDKTIILPTNTVTLSATATDPNGDPMTYLWTKVTGPASGTITTPTALTTIVTGLVQGSYTFWMTATDSRGASNADQVVVTVNGAVGNASPVANAGPDQTITLPTSTITLTGTGTDSDGTIASYLWTKTAGPTAGTITTPSSASTTVTGLVQGTYTFQLQVTDNLGAIGTDTMNVVVNGGTPPNPGNFAIWNPLDKGAKVALSNNNMTAAWNGGKGTVRSTIAKSSGKWYWEIKLDNPGNQFIGVADAGASLINTLGFDVKGWSIVVDDGARFHGGNNGIWGPSFSVNDIVGVALDMDTGKVDVYRNGNFVGTMYEGLTGAIYAAWGSELGGSGTANFGASQLSFVPAGYNPGLYGSSSAPVFGIGTRVKTLARVAIRAGAGNNFVKLGIQQKDAIGTIIDGPANGSGYTWWKVDFDTAPDGWVQRQYLGNY